ncbi:MAG: type I DNA topoisomerase [Planctomycetota bacterium]|jgi:DNA topoisomerase-1
MKLVIVESPNKVKKIEGFLGSGYRCAASFGHIRDLPARGDMAVDFSDDTVSPHYEVTKAKQLERLRALARNADEILIATDPDREGEAIGWHLCQALGPQRHYRRVTFNAITKRAVLAAVAEPGELNQALVDAQQARRVLDRVVGWVVSPTLRQGLNDKAARSAGRVQSVALRLLARTEWRIQRFTAHDYFDLSARFAGPPAFTATLWQWQGEDLGHRLAKAADAEAIRSAAEGGPWQVSAADTRTVTRKPPPPFITSTVQQAASVQLKMAPDACMKALQALFEGGHITYHRTDSVALSPEGIDAARTIISDRFGADYLPAKPVNHAAKAANAQEAHEAIRPTKPESGPDPDVIGNHRDLYRLIWQRYIASQMSAGRDATTVYHIISDGAPTCVFRARGTVVMFDGWRRVSADATIERKRERDHDDNKQLPKLAVGDTLTLTELTATAKRTRPPPRFTQASLIKLLEKEGIGRPSTYAAILKTLLDRDYIRDSRRKLAVTDLGMRVVQWLVDHYRGNFIEIEYTRQLEEQLDAISRGELAWQPVVCAEHQRILSLSRAAGGARPAAQPAPADITCPRCSKPMRAIHGRNGLFYGCTAYPSCTGTRNPQQSTPISERPVPAAQPRPTVEPSQRNAPLCPECASAMTLVRDATPPYWSCSQCGCSRRA